MQSPILFLVFNRPDTTARVFEAIRQARPTRLYVAADGARQGRDGEADLCAETRRVASAVDWDCEVRTLFRDENKGCKVAVSDAITWFFEHEERGIILEDDCLPVPDFFRFCDEMLARYQDDPRVTMVSGDNFVQQAEGLKCDGDVYFTVFAHIWGWATWRRAWRGYDVNMGMWNASHGQRLLKKVFPHHGPMRRIWSQIFTDVAAGKINTWDYQWVHHCWVQGGLACAPRVNLISNIGFDERATHTTEAGSEFAGMPTGALTWPLSIPDGVRQHREADDWESARYFDVRRHTWRRVMGRKLKVMLGLRKEA